MAIIYRASVCMPLHEPMGAVAKIQKTLKICRIKTTNVKFHSGILISLAYKHLVLRKIKCGPYFDLIIVAKNKG